MVREEENTCKNDEMSLDKSVLLITIFLGRCNSQNFFSVGLYFMKFAYQHTGRINAYSLFCLGPCPLHFVGSRIRSLDCFRGHLTFPRWGFSESSCLVKGLFVSLEAMGLLPELLRVSYNLPASEAALKQHSFFNEY